MHNKLILVEKFLDDPDYVRNQGLNILDSMHDSFFNDGVQNYPGCRTNLLSECAPDINQELLNKLEFHTNQKIQNLKSMFHITNGSHGCGLVHTDKGSDMAGLIYLNQSQQENAGTKIVKLIDAKKNRVDFIENFFEASTTKDYDIVQKFFEFKKENNNRFRDSVVIQAEYNRMVAYDVNFLHTPGNYFGTNLYNSRLSLVFFVKFVV